MTKCLALMDPARTQKLTLLLVTSQRQSRPESLLRAWTVLRWYYIISPGVYYESPRRRQTNPADATWSTFVIVSQSQVSRISSTLSDIQILDLASNPLNSQLLVSDRTALGTLNWTGPYISINYRIPEVSSSSKSWHRVVSKTFYTIRIACY
jgi:hypothetical protein